MYPGYNTEQALQEDRIRELTAGADQSGAQSGLFQRLAAFTRAQVSRRRVERRAVQPRSQANFREQVQP